jgi:hypothetical protein
MALPAYQYRDPMMVLEQKQEHELKKTCIGCAHAFEIMFNSGPAKGCNKHKLYGRRCNLFQEVK